MDIGKFHWISENEKLTDTGFFFGSFLGIGYWKIHCLTLVIRILDINQLLVQKYIPVGGCARAFLPHFNTSVFNMYIVNSTKGHGSNTFVFLRLAYGQIPCNPLQERV